MVAHESGNSGSRHGNPADNASAGAVKPKTVYVGNNQYPISTVQLADVSEIAWMNKSCLGFLTSLVSSLGCGHNLSDMITLVYNEVSMDMYSVFQDSEKKMVKLMEVVFIVDNLFPSEILNA